MDETELARQEMVEEINSNAADRKTLEARYGTVWDTKELSENFEVTGFMAPFVVVRKISNGEKGSLKFQHQPRFYFEWEPDQLALDL